MKNNPENSVFFLSIRRYLTEYLPRTRNVSNHTIQSVKDSINLLMDYCHDILNMKLTEIKFDTFLDFNVINGFLNWIEEHRGCSNNTINHRLSCIRGFFRYAAYENAEYTSLYNQLCSIPQRKTDKNKTIEFMSEEELKILLLCPDTKKLRGLRDCFYMTLLYDSAARNSEILNLKIKDINNSKNPYIYVDGKGRKKRTIPLMSKTMDIYEIYIRRFHGNNLDINDYLFYIKHGDIKCKMSDDNVAKFISKYSRQAKEQMASFPDSLHPHMFRRTRAMHLYRNGMPLPLLSEFLGHEDPSTTLIYASADTEMKRKAIEKYSVKLNINEDLRKEAIWKNDDEMIRKLYGLR